MAEAPSENPEAAPNPATSRILHAAVVDELATSQRKEPPAPRRRRIALPLILFLLTCLSTTWVGANRWFPGWWFLGDFYNPLEASLLPRQMLLAHWDDGLIYTACVLAILVTHEMGHFLATVLYRIPASLPYVVPLPISPLGTLGAVIGMDSRRADRKQMFDIGLAGPIAGLVVAVPILIWGIMQLDFTQPKFGPMALQNPLLIEGLLRVIRPPGYTPWATIETSQLNPYFMAGWAGMLVTGLNMMPVSQLDGGHVVHALFGRHARWIARGFIVAAILYCIVTRNGAWSLMLVLVLLVGIDHPPTRDDRVPIGWFRFCLGLASLAIPVLCFAPRAISG